MTEKEILLAIAGPRLARQIEERRVRELAEKDSENAEEAR